MNLATTPPGYASGLINNIPMAYKKTQPIIKQLSFEISKRENNSPIWARIFPSAAIASRLFGPTTRICLLPFAQSTCVVRSTPSRQAKSYQLKLPWVKSCDEKIILVSCLV